MMVFALSLSFVGCKKGENDPFISLKSRDGRITGTWKLSNVDQSNENTTNSSGKIVSTTTTEKYDGTNWTSSGFGPANTFPFSYEITIEKDGTWSSIEIDDGDTKEESGYWSWTDSKKNKTGIFIANAFWTIDQLKNKEMITINDTFDKDTDKDEIFTENLGKDTRTYTKK